jgi:hypothetical protein
VGDLGVDLQDLSGILEDISDPVEEGGDVEGTLTGQLIGHRGLLQIKMLHQDTNKCLVLAIHRD